MSRGDFMKPVQYRITKTVIPTYPQPQPEELPMFAENRVHQRTSGRPYPNKVVLSVDRSCKENKEYTLITLENDSVKIEILPEIGGRLAARLRTQTKPRAQPLGLGRIRAGVV